MRDIEFKHFALDLRQHWSEWFTGHFNWRSFTLIELSYEDECYLGQREIVIAILGFYCRIHWCYDEGAAGAVMVRERLADIIAHPECAVELDEILNRTEET